jgi:hypothetical protein
MTPRLIVYFDNEKTPLKKPMRLYISNGIVMNPKVEETAKATEDMHIVAIRRIGEKKRSLVWDGKEVEDAKA